MVQTPKKRFVLRAAFVVLVMAPVWTVVLVPGLSPADLLARHLGNQLHDVPDELVTNHLQQIARLDEPGTEILVAAMGSRRAIVVESAGRALHQQLDQWQALKARESSPRVARLAELLATSVDHWNASTQSIAADLVARILQWPIDTRTVSKPDLLTHCEQIVQAVANQLPSRRAIPTSPGLEPGATVPASHTVVSETDPSGILDLPLTGVPGGDLPITEVPIPPMPPSLVSPSWPRPVTGDEPQLVPPTERPLPRIIFPDGHPEPEPEPVLPTSPIPRQLPAGAEDDPESTKLAPASATISDLDLEHMSDLDLFHNLLSSSPTDLVGVEQQLRQRGFDEHQLSLARRVASPDPLVRRQLVESLPGLSISPGPWLFWLSYDVDPMVRSLTVSYMATSQDPRLHRRLREMRSMETDEAVRAQLEKLRRVP